MCCQCVCLCISYNATIVSEKVCKCEKSGNICVLESSKSSSVMPAVHTHNFESISVAEEIIKTMPTVHMCKQNYVHMHVLSMHTPTQLLVALKNCK